jgi:hypothetical protein
LVCCHPEAKPKDHALTQRVILERSEGSCSYSEIIDPSASPQDDSVASPQDNDAICPTSPVPNLTKLRQSTIIWVDRHHYDACQTCATVSPFSPPPLSTSSPDRYVPLILDLTKEEANWQVC